MNRRPATSTIWRALTRRGLVTPQPRKRPKGAGKRFAADLPNELWQADLTHWQLADGTSVEIHHILDDHSRLAITSKARTTTTGPDVLTDFRAAFRRHGIPRSVPVSYTHLDVYKRQAKMSASSMATSPTVSSSWAAISSKTALESVCRSGRVVRCGGSPESFCMGRSMTWLRRREIRCPRQCRSS